METPNPRAMEVNLETDQQVQSKDKPQRTELKRGLSARHMQMIAIGGAIGTGLFVASGATISTAGPGGALAAYAVIGLMVLLLMQSLGEMSAHMPVAGSFQTYATRFVSPSFGFAMGWNYWFNWAITVAAELVASGLVMSYWLPSVPSWVWAISFLFLLTFLNALSARVYGEAEFWFALIKVITVIVFLISGTLMIFGIFNDSPGVQNWTAGDAPFHGGFLSIISVFMIAGFSFQGTELVGVAAGESSNPRRDVPRAIKTVFWRQCRRHCLLALHPGLRAHGCCRGSRGHERRHLDRNPFRRKLRPVRLHANAALDGAHRAGASLLCKGHASRRTDLRNAGHLRRRRTRIRCRAGE